MFSYFFQYEQLNGESVEKLRALIEIKETVQHRKHLDSSIDFIGRLIFGFEKGPSMLEAVRATGQPLVDDWDCLKRMVSILIFLIRLWHKACTWSSLLLHIRIQSVSSWTYLILMAFARCGFSNPIVVHLLSMAWSTWERLQTFATVVYLRWKWGSQASALAAATTRRGGARWLRDTALDDRDQ